MWKQFNNWLRQDPNVFSSKATTCINCFVLYHSYGLLWWRKIIYIPYQPVWETSPFTLNYVIIPSAVYSKLQTHSKLHNPFVMDLINPSSAPIPLWTALLCRKRTRPQTSINPSDGWGAKCLLCHQSTEQQPPVPWGMWGGELWHAGSMGTSNWGHSSFRCPRYENTRGN